MEMSASLGQLSLSSLETKLEIRLRWFEPVQRRDRGYYGERMLKMELPGTREGKD